MPPEVIKSFYDDGYRYMTKVDEMEQKNHGQPVKYPFAGQYAQAIKEFAVEAERLGEFSCKSSLAKKPVMPITDEDCSEEDLKAQDLMKSAKKWLWFLRAEGPANKQLIYADAIPLLEEVLSMKPKHVKAKKRLGKAYNRLSVLLLESSGGEMNVVEKKRLIAEAIAVLEKLLLLKPNQGKAKRKLQEAYHELATLLLMSSSGEENGSKKRGLIEEAIALLEKTLSKNSDDCNAKELLGIAYDKLSMVLLNSFDCEENINIKRVLISEAIAALEKVLSINPGDKDAEKRLQNAYWQFYEELKPCLVGLRIKKQRVA